MNLLEGSVLMLRHQLRGAMFEIMLIKIGLWFAHLNGHVGRFIAPALTYRQ